MKSYSLSERLFFTLMLFGFTCQAYAEDSNIIPTMKVLWQKEIAPDANLDCSLGPVTFDKTSQKLLITGTSFRPRVYSEGKFWLMEVDTNSGDIVNRTTIKEVNESKATLMLASSFLKGLSISENNDITLIGKFDSSAPPIMRINRNGNSSKFIELTDGNNDANKNRDDFSQIHSSINFSNGSILLIGGGKNGGIIKKVDSAGKQLWERNYKIGRRQIDLFTDGITRDGEELLIVGCSTDVKGKFPDVMGDDFIVRCNKQGDIVVKDIFLGNPWPGEQPQVCQINSGNFIVIYGKGMQFKRSDINIRAYSPDLKFLWEKQVVESKENKPSSFRIVATSSEGFIVAANVDFGNLRVYKYDEKGNQIANFSMDKVIKLVNIGLTCSDNKAFVVFPTRSKIEQDKGLSKIKIMALRL